MTATTLSPHHTAVQPGAPATSAASACGYRVPRQYVWMSDVVVQALAFAAAYSLVPVLQPLIVPGGALHASWLTWLSLPGAAAHPGFRPVTELLWVLLVTIPATLVAVDVLGGYSPLLEQTRARVLSSSVLAPVLGLACLSLLLVGAKSTELSRAFVFIFAATTAIGFWAHRTAVRVYKARRLNAGYYARNVLVIGSNDAVAALRLHFERTVPPQFYRLVGHLDTNGASSFVPGLSSGNVPVVGHVADLGEILVHRPIHQVIAVQCDGAQDWMHDVVGQCAYFQVTLRIVSEPLLTAMQSGLPVPAGPPLHLPEIVLAPRHFESDALFLKRFVDIVVSAVLLLLLSPLFALIALAIKLTTPHLPVFYPWRVVGYKGRTFTGYKFTTMELDADERKAELMALNEMSGPVFKIRNDPRVTPLGRFLRKFSLNELPQLWSVFKGDMSLVGPRPAYPHELARYELWQKRKLCVQPGITCLWQISGRNRISNFDDWVRLDFEYIDNWSIWLDCRILARTAWAVITGSGY